MSIELQTVKVAVKIKGKEPLRLRMITELCDAFRKEAIARQKKGLSIDASIWFEEYKNDKKYKDASAIFNFLGMAEKDVKGCMQTGINNYNRQLLQIPAELVASTSTKDYTGTPRNSPCPCGSGKKYKRCHGA
jgi:preprotein translocase subunit SecA